MKKKLLTAACATTFVLSSAMIATAAESDSTAVMTFTFEDSSEVETDWNMIGGAAVVENPDDANDKVLCVGTGAGGATGTYAETKAGLFSNTTFSNGFTISMDVRPTQNLSDWNYLFSFGQSPNSVFNYVDGTIGFISRFGDKYADFFPATGWQAGNTVNSEYTYFTATDANCDKWYRFTYVYSAPEEGNGELAIYVDGVLATKWTPSESQVTDLQTIFGNFGKASTLALGTGIGRDNCFGGYIDDVNVYNQALNASQVAALGAPSDVSDKSKDSKSYLIAAYTFDNKDGLTLKGDANIVANPNDETDSVLCVDTSGGGKNGNYATTESGVFQNVDFSEGFTISMDVRPTANSSDFNYLFGFGKTSPWNYVDGTIGFIARTGDTYVAYYPGDGWQEGNTVNSDFAYFKSENNSGKWYRMTYVYSKNEVAIYVDGVKATSWTVADTANMANILSPIGFNGELHLGCGIDTTLENFGGYMDDVMVYNKALTAEEVKNIENDVPAATSTSNTYVQYKKVSEGNYTVRFVSEVALSDLGSYSQIGFRCSKTATGAGESYFGTKVFKTINANGHVKTAAAGKYFVVFEIKNVTNTDTTLYAQPMITKTGETSSSSLGKEVSVKLSDIIK